ncbi:MAG: penicillin-binding transpeptidase domain-containing protein [Angelakisella sp.]
MEKKIVIIYVALLCFVSAVILRLSTIIQGNTLAQAATVQSSYALTVGESRGTIYDRNLKPLVNRKSYNVLSVVPTPSALTALQKNLPRDEFLQLFPLLESGKPVLLRPSRAVSGGGIESFQFPVRYSTAQLAPHIIGYLDGSGEGITGVEAGYNELLNSYGGRVRTRYYINAIGMALGEEVAEVSDTRPQKEGGLVLTLDRDIQRIAEAAAEPLVRGAVVVMDVKSGEILAMVSRPDFDPYNVGAALKDSNSPLFNRALAAYNLGSIFKLTVAAAALEQGFTPAYTYVCPGYYQLGEQRYHCHQRAGHWELAMERALEQSCNPYFINLGQQLGAKRICTMAAKMGFGEPAKLAEGIASVGGNLPAAEDVSLGELANLSFGQGSLMATPVQVAHMTAIIGGGGSCPPPSLYRGTTVDGSVVTTQDAPSAPRVISENTAKTLQQLMVQVVEKGSGRRAQSGYGGAGGKTSSAQTGSFKNGIEVVHGWFTGFYPAEEPQYAITVLEEGGGDGGQLPAEIFAQICRETALQNDPFLRRMTK